MNDNWRVDFMLRLVCIFFLFVFSGVLASDLDAKCDLCMGSGDVSQSACQKCAAEINRMMFESQPEQLGKLVEKVKMTAHAGCQESNLASKACQVYQALCKEGECDESLIGKIFNFEQNLHATVPVV
ncbi:MAG: hypothetical protein VX737_01740 [Pseudomonadota bacterium]|nr:hypothetical protein [Pseudomonadota bacterium]